MPAGAGLTDALTKWAADHDAPVVITRDDTGWSLMSNFGSEAPDSPMAGGSLIAAEDGLSKCIEQALAQARVNPCAKCGWDRTCPDDECHS